MIATFSLYSSFLINRYIFIYRAIYDALCELYAEETDKARVEAQESRENSRKAQLMAEREAAGVFFAWA